MSVEANTHGGFLKSFILLCFSILNQMKKPMWVCFCLSGQKSSDSHHFKQCPKESSGFGDNDDDDEWDLEVCSEAKTW